MDGSATIAEILERILTFTDIDPDLRANLREGLSLEQIQQKLANFPFRLPKEVEELYQWHDGINLDTCEPELFHYHTFLPLDQALATRAGWLEFNEEYDVYPPELLPLFEFQGEYYTTRCSSEAQVSAPIVFLHHDTTPVFNSLKTMLLAILECYETGAYQPIFEDGLVNTTIDKQRVADIKLRHNPVRQEIYDELTARKDIYYHP